MITQIKTLFFVIMALLMCYLYNTNERLNRELDIAISNNKAYESENDSILMLSRKYQLTIDELVYKNDSVSRRIVSLIEDSKVRKNKIQELTYLLSEYTRVDSIFVTDTIFKDPTFVMDTIVGDSWFNTKLHLEYPGIISLTPKVVSEYAVVVSGKKETIKPPKKFFIARWFQRKHTVLEVTVVSSNPYEFKRTQRFIKILKND